MKFGKKFKENIIPEWRTQYLDYKEGKKIIKRLRKVALDEIEYGQLPQDEFIEFIEKELQKINEFYTRTERRFAERHGQLLQQIEKLVENFFVL